MKTKTERERRTVREKEHKLASWSYELMKCHWTQRESGTWNVERGTHDVKQTEMQMSREKLFDDNIMTDIIMWYGHKRDPQPNVA